MSCRVIYRTRVLVHSLRRLRLRVPLIVFWTAANKVRNNLFFFKPPPPSPKKTSAMFLTCNQ